MTVVQELRPGDVVEGPLGMGLATFIGAMPHPLYGGLQLVIWRMANGSVSFDALSPYQYVGNVPRMTPEYRKRTIEQALGIKRAE
jgi:hypothetical protein